MGKEKHVIIVSKYLNWGKNHYGYHFRIIKVKGNLTRIFDSKQTGSGWFGQVFRSSRWLELSLGYFEYGSSEKSGFIIIWRINGNWPLIMWVQFSQIKTNTQIKLLIFNIDCFLIDIQRDFFHYVILVNEIFEIHCYNEIKLHLTYILEIYNERNKVHSFPNVYLFS